LDAGPNILQELENCMNSFISKYIPKEKVACKRNKSQQEDEDEISNS
ncbi:14014_t:CDS:1, partial [Racocetra persica]